MTIKKRLFISNILMIVISIILASIITTICVFTLNSIISDSATKDLEYYKNVQPIRSNVVEQIENYLSNENDTLLNFLKLKNITIFLDSHDMRLDVKQSDKTILSLNDANYAYKKNIYSYNNKGKRAFDDIYCEKININNTQYMIYIYNLKIVDENEQRLQMQIVLSISVIVALITAVLLTNKILTKFVFDKISEPLQMLSKGVHEISEGNLSYQITYDNDDEFSLVCDDFNGMALRLKDSIEKTNLEEESRKQLLASISHDLRSPLTSIKAYIEGLIDGVASTPEMQKAYMNTIKTKTEDIDRLVSRLFMFSKLNIGQISNETEIINVNKDIHTIIESLSYDYSNNNVTIQCNLNGSLFINADPTYFYSIISNILDNSVKYKPDDTDLIIDITTSESESYVIITISDNGIGVPNDSLNKIFDVFYRVDSSRTNPKKGSGLGLAITSKAVKSMGGTISAENGKLGGLAITIQLPKYKGEINYEK